MAVLPKQWRFYRNNGRFYGTMAVWSDTARRVPAGHGFCPTMAFFMERWRFLWNDGRFYGTMAVFMERWPFLWNDGRFLSLLQKIKVFS
jgi:hypothetical protein